MMKKLPRRSKMYTYSVLMLAGFASYLILPEVLHRSATGISLAAVGGSQQSATPQLTGQSPAGEVITIGEAPLGVSLYDQFSGACAADAISSQNFETAFNSFDDEAADDFVVPAGQIWTVQEVDVLGLYFGAGPASSFNVVFYADAGGFPGAVECSLPNQPFTQTATLFSITLPTLCVLSPGTHWVSVQTNQNLNPNGQWFWSNRTPQANNGAAWRNPGNGFGTGCAGFGRRSVCVVGTAACPDQAFRLLGSAVTFDVCLQDDSSRDFMLINSSTGDYIYQKCGAGGFTVTGKGIVRIRGGIVTLEHYGPDRKIVARIDNSVKKGTAGVVVASGPFTITDRNTANNTCSCSGGGS
jgi:hypothetical protein